VFIGFHSLFFVFGSWAPRRGGPELFSEIPALPASFRCRQRPDERIRHRVNPTPMARNSVCNIFYQNVSIFAGDCPAEIFDFPNAGPLSFASVWYGFPTARKAETHRNRILSVPVRIFIGGSILLLQS